MTLPIWWPRATAAKLRGKCQVVTGKVTLRDDLTCNRCPSSALKSGWGCSHSGSITGRMSTEKLHNGHPIMEDSAMTGSMVYNIMTCVYHISHSILIKCNRYSKYRYKNMWVHYPPQPYGIPIPFQRTPPTHPTPPHPLRYYTWKNLQQKKK